MFQGSFFFFFLYTNKYFRHFGREAEDEAFVYVWVAGGAWQAVFITEHYENTPIQVYRKFHLQKQNIFR